MKKRKPIRIALCATHPIQYQVPWFQGLAEVPELEFMVFYGMIPDAVQQGAGFGISFEWDIPLLTGYRWKCLQNTARNPSPSTFLGCNTPDITTVLREWQPDVVVVTGWHSLMLVQTVWAAIRLRIPRLVRGETHSLSPRPKWKRLGHRLWLRAFNGFLSIGGANRSFYEEAGVSANRIFICRYFVDNKRFASNAARLRAVRDDLRRQWNVPTDCCCFLYSGKLTDQKRPIDIIRAIEKARHLGADVHLLVAGTGDLLAEAQHLTQGSELPVTFVGFLNQTEVARAYAAADCIVLPGRETWGLVVNEAMACGIPAVVSDQVGCGPDLIIEGDTGEVFPLGDIDALANKLVNLAADMDRLRSMGDRAQRRVLEEYSVENAVTDTLAAIRATAVRQLVEPGK